MYFESSPSEFFLDVPGIGHIIQTCPHVFRGQRKGALETNELNQFGLSHVCEYLNLSSNYSKTYNHYSLFLQNQSNKKKKQVHKLRFY